MGFGTLNVELSRFIANSDSEFVDKVDHVGAPAIGDDGHAERGGAVCDGSQDCGGGGGNYRDVVRMEVGDVEVASVGGDRYADRHGVDHHGSHNGIGGGVNDRSLPTARTLPP
jgi:hypothetical protein